MKHFLKSSWILLFLINIQNFKATPIDTGSKDSKIYPGARYGSATWTDENGNLWIFGGNGYDASGNLGFLNDLWKYDNATKQWTRIKGHIIRNQPGIYGQLGIADEKNNPGGRAYSSASINKNKELLLFGGYGNDSNGETGSLNDMWVYNISTGIWTWIDGSKIRNQTGTFDLSIK